MVQNLSLTLTNNQVERLIDTLKYVLLNPLNPSGLYLYHEQEVHKSEQLVLQSWIPHFYITIASKMSPVYIS